MTRECLKNLDTRKKMNSVEHKSGEIRYKVIRTSRKKTISIHVTPDSVTVRTPKWISEKNIRGLVEKKSRWIVLRQALIRQHKMHYPPRDFASGESFPYLGRQYRLKVILTEKGIPPTCLLINGLFCVTVGEDLGKKEEKLAVQNALSEWYKAQAENKIWKQLPLFAEKLGRWPTSIIVKNQKSRWGSCSRTGVLRFNWKIIMAPVSVLDYLIVHELCHLFHQDHSPAYWRKVQTILPDYKKSRICLREYDAIMREF